MIYRYDKYDRYSMKPAVSILFPEMTNFTKFVCVFCVSVIFM